ncbi:MAG TPA: N-acetylmuramidase domain-containing protein [Vicinamibacterales bacterium]|nr:N-acetylmuramidase domain-containing protein [Vicinamibacterales bacterium]
MEFVGRSNPLTSNGMATVATNLSVGVQELWTVLNVETSGCGFLPDRRPEILYERHIFHRLTGARFDDGDLSDPTAGGYGAGGAHQYDRLAAAMKLDRGAALQSASWGLGQVLGENFKVAGFPSVDEMIQAMSDSEDTQLVAVGAFIVGNRLDRALATHDWASFARGYNGPAFATNLYDVRLRGEFQKLSAGVLPNLDIRAAQLFLTFRGFHPGPIDGFVGPRTRAALVAFQQQNNLSPTGLVDDDLLEVLTL